MTKVNLFVVERSELTRHQSNDANIQYYFNLIYHPKNAILVSKFSSSDQEKKKVEKRQREIKQGRRDHEVRPFKLLTRV